jgi:hypothetical protein
LFRRKKLLHLHSQYGKRGGKKVRRKRKGAEMMGLLEGDEEEGKP